MYKFALTIMINSSVLALYGPAIIKKTIRNPGQKRDLRIVHKTLEKIINVTKTKPLKAQQKHLMTIKNHLKETVICNDLTLLPGAIVVNDPQHRFVNTATQVVFVDTLLIGQRIEKVKIHSQNTYNKDFILPESLYTCIGQLALLYNRSNSYYKKDTDIKHSVLAMYSIASTEETVKNQEKKRDLKIGLETLKELISSMKCLEKQHSYISEWRKATMKLKNSLEKATVLDSSLYCDEIIKKVCFKSIFIGHKIEQIKIHSQNAYNKDFILPESLYTRIGQLVIAHQRAEVQKSLLSYC